MDFQNVITRIEDDSRKTENIYMNLSNAFPKMLSNSSKTTVNELMELFESLIASKNLHHIDLASLGVKYNEILKLLNEKIESLNKINNGINVIRANSDEIEVIALNALVVSIKSGEKGKAFSIITENLQRLSKSMFVSSGKLVEQKEKLISSIQLLKDTFTAIRNDQHMLLDVQIPAIYTGIDKVLVAVDPLQQIITLSKSVYPLIRNAMESIQLQDIIKQALSHVHASLSSYSRNFETESIEKQLECVTFNYSIVTLSKDVLMDLDSYFLQSITVFDESWASVLSMLNQTEKARREYLGRFFVNRDDKENNLYLRIQSIIDSFTKLIADIRNFKSEHKKISGICSEITTTAQNVRSEFINFAPIMTNLKHVQILQSIEVAKNDAISSVRDIIHEIDGLIVSTTSSLDEIQVIIEGFISGIGDMIDSLSVAAVEDENRMSEVESENKVLLDNFVEKRDQIYEILTHFEVYPAEFTSEAAEINLFLDQLKKERTAFDELKNELDAELSVLAEKKTALMKTAGVDSWEISDSKMKDLIKHFTITSHKEAAGKIAGVEVESGATPGDITFF